MWHFTKRSGLPAPILPLNQEFYVRNKTLFFDKPCQLYDFFIYCRWRFDASVSSSGFIAMKMTQKSTPRRNARVIWVAAGLIVRTVSPFYGLNNIIDLKKQLRESTWLCFTLWLSNAAMLLNKASDHHDLRFFFQKPPPVRFLDHFRLTPHYCFLINGFVMWW